MHTSFLTASRWIDGWTSALFLHCRLHGECFAHTRTYFVRASLGNGYNGRIAGYMGGGGGGVWQENDGGVTVARSRGIEVA